MAGSRVVLALGERNGRASYGELLRAGVPRRALATAVRAGEVERVSRGRYAIPGRDEALRAADAVGGVVSHGSAVALYGWSRWGTHAGVDVTVDPGRTLARGRRRRLRVHWQPLAADEVVDQVTGPLRTVQDCARSLPLASALSIADSALRTGALTRSELIESLDGLPRTGARAARRVLTHASGLAANPFESALRALSLEAVGPLFVPQGEVVLPDGSVVHPDLVCRERRIVAEADSFTYHTHRAAITRDCWRYDELALAGWLVLRFSWDQAALDPDWCRGTIARAVLARPSRAAGL